MSKTAEPKQKVAVAITGASGAQYGLRLIECLLDLDIHVCVMVSKAAQLVINTETDLTFPAKPQAQTALLASLYLKERGALSVYADQQWTAPVASGSGEVIPLIICPASTGTLSAVATGASNNLIERAADVALKERRPLILVPRETPYSAIHLEHMLALTRMGAVVLPASPGFYHQPQTMNDLIDFVVARILSHLRLPQTLVPRWGD